MDEGRTAVLADGIPINDAWGEWIDWGRMPKAMLDRVEVVEGGTSNLYGNGAMGGVISFFTRPLAPGAMDMQVDGGSRGAKHAFIGGGVPLIGALSAERLRRLSGEGRLRDDRCADRRARSTPRRRRSFQRNAYARLNYAPSSNWSAFVGGHFFGDSRNPGTPLSYANRDQRDVDPRRQLRHRIRRACSASARGTAARSRSQRSTAFRAAATRAVEDSSLTRGDSEPRLGRFGDVDAQRHLVGLESFSVGGDFRHYQGDFNEVDFNTSGCATAPTGATCHTLARNVSSGGAQSLSGVFVQAILAPFTPLRIELSARGDRWDNTDGHSLTTTPGQPSTNVVVRRQQQERVLAARRRAVQRARRTSRSTRAYYRAFRAPNLAELYRKQVSPTSITIPNPFLKAENAEGREAGFDFQPIDWLQVKGTWYVADYNNFNVPTNLTRDVHAADAGGVRNGRRRAARVSTSTSRAAKAARRTSRCVRFRSCS